MNIDRPLRGSCHCGRNLYIIQLPQTQPAHQSAQILFHTHPSHNLGGGPLPSYLRVPLSAYHSLTLPLNPDETHAQIHRAYTSLAADTRHTTMRHFCGFCGTPLSYWSEGPAPGEADFIQLSLGSLVPGDLADLEDWGLLESPREGSPLPSSGDGDAEMGEGAGGEGEGGGGGGVVVGRVGVLPWFEGLVEGSKLGKLRKGTGRPGTVRVEWEIVEWTEEGEGEGEGGGGESPRKRKLEEVEGGLEGMEGVQQ